MTKDEYKDAVGKGEVAPAAPQPSASSPLDKSLSHTLDDFLPILLEIRSPKQHLAAAPTFVPRTFLEQIQLMDDGAGTERLYLYVNGTWRYVALT